MGLCLFFAQADQIKVLSGDLHFLGVAVHFHRDLHTGHQLRPHQAAAFPYQAAGVEDVPVSLAAVFGPVVVRVGKAVVVRYLHLPDLVAVALIQIQRGADIRVHLGIQLHNMVFSDDRNLVPLTVDRQITADGSIRVDRNALAVLAGVPASEIEVVVDRIHRHQITDRLTGRHLHLVIDFIAVLCADAAELVGVPDECHIVLRVDIFLHGNDQLALFLAAQIVGQLVIYDTHTIVFIHLRVSGNNLVTALRLYHQVNVIIKYIKQTGCGYIVAGNREHLVSLFGQLLAAGVLHHDLQHLLLVPSFSKVGTCQAQTFSQQDGLSLSKLHDLNREDLHVGVAARILAANKRHDLLDHGRIRSGIIGIIHSGGIHHRCIHSGGIHGGGIHSGGIHGGGIHSGGIHSGSLGDGHRRHLFRQLFQGHRDFLRVLKIHVGSSLALCPDDAVFIHRNNVFLAVFNIPSSGGLFRIRDQCLLIAHCQGQCLVGRLIFSAGQCTHRQQAQSQHHCHQQRQASFPRLCHSFVLLSNDEYETFGSRADLAEP